MNTTSVGLFSEHFQACVIRWIYTKIFLAQFLFGFSGNILNLLILLSKKMRSRTNLLFAAMAFSDLAFLAIQFQTYLYTSGLLSNSLNVLFREHNTRLVAIANWFSALSIWLMLAVTIERLAVIRRPFQASQKAVTPKFLVCLTMIVAFSFTVTFVHHIAFKKVYVHGIMHIEMIKHPLISIWTLVQALSVVIVPCILMAVLNILLILSLKKHTFPMDMLIGQQHKDLQPIVIAKSKTEKKVTIMVIVILSSFTLCNMPGAILYILIQFANEQPTAFHKALANCLAITGKMLNFVLFCMSSSHFRKNLIEHLKGCFSRLRRRPSTSFSMLTHHSSQQEHSPIAARAIRPKRNDNHRAFHVRSESASDGNSGTYRNTFAKPIRLSEYDHPMERSALNRMTALGVSSDLAL
ncbi:Putative G-protein coupled receptor F59B2.13 [Toxocara canis]|uniref:Putative G-protein coupled receptor F59B2.13 n=1 Tax=Toxocara canis TaxID=6265 RepID=A0A0B2VIK2_TOXCA|nr:Putative G-protein coupled receptor F59B2.13 [Toxocara canis]